MCRFRIKYFFSKQQEALISSSSLSKVSMGAGQTLINTLRSQAGCCSLYGWPRVLGWALLAIFPYFSIG